MAEGLFEMQREPIEAVPKLSADRRRTLRQAGLIARGRHPLAALSPLVVRHPETLPSSEHAYSRDDPRGQPYTCGSCRFRQVIGGDHQGRFPKCLRRPDDSQGAGWPFLTFSAATDCRAWWPACTRYEAGDQGLSPDAARCLPDGPP